MRIDCMVDGKSLSLMLNSNKPLSMVLMENLENETTNVHCRGNMCGLCIVLINDMATLSCSVPAFEMQGKNIITFESFSKERDYKDIEKAYEFVGVKPCRDCYPSRTLLIEQLVRQEETRKEEILRELSIIKCPCLDNEDQVKIVQKAIELRRKRHARRS